MPDFNRRHVMVLGSGLLVSACSLPRGAARESELLDSARGAKGHDYAIYRVTRAFVPDLARWPMTGSGPRVQWLKPGAARGTPRLAPGDLVTIVIWDNEQNSLLTAPGQKSVTLNDLKLDPKGEVFLPYVGNVTLAGLTPEQAREKIQQRLGAISTSAQAQVTVIPGRKNSVDLVGGVAKPGIYPLRDGDVTLLSLLSVAGGVTDVVKNPVVRLNRNGHVFITTVPTLYGDPRYDVVLRGGDKVIIEPDPRTFIALGAARREQLIQFPKDKVTALDALAELGGVNYFRANPKGILVLRQYTEADVRKGGRGPGAAQVIFVIDMTTADGLFAAGKFQIHPDDLVYVSESPLTTVNTVSGILGTILGLGQRSQNLIN